MSAADTNAPAAGGAHLNHRVLRMELPAGQLERLHDGQDLFHTGNGGQRLGLEFVLVADNADDGAVLALADVRLESQLHNPVEDVIDLLARGMGTYDDDHVKSGVRGQGSGVRGQG